MVDSSNTDPILSVAHHYLDRDEGVRFHYVSQGDKSSGQTVVLLHGFPEFWFQWRHIIPLLVAAGHRCLAIDMRGYGETTCPLNDKSFTNAAVIGDIVAMLDAENVDKTHIVGHDAGALPVWLIARAHPDRIKSCAVLSVPYFPEGERYIPAELFAKQFPLFSYQLVFQRNGCQDAATELGKDSKVSYRHIFESPFIAKEDNDDEQKQLLPMDPKGAVFQFVPPELPPYKSFSEEDIDAYVANVDATPDNGKWLSMLYWYRDQKRELDFDWAKANKVPTTIEVPTLMITSEYDRLLPPALAAPMANFVPNLKRAHAKNSGHFIASDEPKWLADELLGFFKNAR